MTARDTLKRAQAGIVKVRDLRDQKRTIEGGIDDAQTDAITAMRSNKVESLTFRDPGNAVNEITGTIVEQSSLDIDEARLKRKVGAAVWKTITKTVLDRDLLEQAVAEGRVRAAIVADCSSERPKKPYIRITEKVRKH